MEKKYTYIGYWFLLLIPLTVLGFYHPYFQHFPNVSDFKIAIHIHAFIASVWVLLLIAQPFLIANKKYNAHRKLGRFSYLWFPVLIASFIPLMVNVLNSEVPQGIFFSAADLILLILFYSQAIVHRKNTALHMRYMILTTIVFLGPTVGRIAGIIFDQPLLMSQGIFYASIALLLTILIMRDNSKVLSRPYIIGSFCYALHAVVFYFIFP